jgi:hypothetical protein
VPPVTWGMLKTNRTARIDELRSMLDAYRHLTVEEVEDGNWGDVQIEVEAELWRLEQERHRQAEKVRFAA